MIEKLWENRAYLGFPILILTGMAMAWRVEEVTAMAVYIVLAFQGYAIFCVFKPATAARWMNRRRGSGRQHAGKMPKWKRLFAELLGWTILVGGCGWAVLELVGG